MNRIFTKDRSFFSRLGLFVAVLLASGCEKFELDRQMEELCKKDGGVKVYETVTLPESMFDQLGDPFPGWPKRSREDRLGSDYRFIEKTDFIKNGDPMKGEGRLTRSSQKILRLIDGKLLGESATYSRAGGDFIAYAHPSSSSCPVYKSANDTLIRSVFIKRD
jgi:hypothetical protein